MSCKACRDWEQASLSLIMNAKKTLTVISRTSDNIILHMLKTSLSNATEQAFIDGGGGDKINQTIYGIAFILKKLLWIEEREIR